MGVRSKTIPAMRRIEMPRAPKNVLHLLLVALLSAFLFGSSAIAQIPAGTLSTSDTTPPASWDLPTLRFVAIVSIVFLMGGLFVILFWWQKHIEQAGYFARIYQETIEKIETTRLAAPIDEKWARGEYIAEILLERSQRGKHWVELNKRPLAKDFLITHDPQPI
jgi:hypothetical protein